MAVTKEELCVLPSPAPDQTPEHHTGGGHRSSGRSGLVRIFPPPSRRGSREEARDVEVVVELAGVDVHERGHHFAELELHVAGGELERREGGGVLVGVRGRRRRAPVLGRRRRGAP